MNLLHRFFIALVWLILPLYALAQDRQAWQPARLLGAEERLLHSPETGRDYRIQVAKIGEPPANGYPVLYVLDGDGLFPLATLLAQGMNMRAGEHQASPMLVVGIGYDNGKLLDLAARAEDFTPASASYAHSGDRLSQRFGGAEAFSQFLTGRLRETIAAEFPINRTQQSLFGHSYGGLFTLHQLLTRPQSFRHYLISSPSIWWNQNRVLQDFPQFAERLAAAPQPLAVRISAGEYEQKLAPHLPANAEREAMMQARRMVDAAGEAAQRLERDGGQQIQVVYQTYPGQTHGTVTVHALLDGIRWLFAQCQADANCR
ncbi:esterase [Lysobacteraceae bacterium NML120232]|nr:esterase [Xanthomonadaceae bacterium NML08-0793]PJK13733.1 esterase [Xanthomonadaceae bacterium NML120232]